MVTMQHPSSERRSDRPRWWRTLRMWERALLAAIVLGALVMSAGLIYYGPRLQTAAPTQRTVLATTPTPGQATPPGNDLWYYWGQSQPLNQQP